ncbi:hypothetical protein AB205_0054370 [Aquarana catesbeiana]|uniref:Zinc finger CCHC domain-containing protein n=1 Tax=Aquarana catesbeiana TaxID=8400 RepID=A0A2G9RPT3_AQUCT|nr:hypothetical protein AB205_0054370 [Aquarana catesbeiana]
MVVRRIQDSLRFVVKSGFWGEVTLRTAVMDLLTGVLGLEVRDILCLQDFPYQCLYDVTFISTEVCWNIFEKFKLVEEGEVGRKFAVQEEKEPTHPFKVGNMVVVQQLNRSKKREYPFGPPTTVVAVTRTAVLVENCQSWILASRVKKVVQRPGSKKEILDTGGPQADVQADEGGVPGKAGPAREDDFAYFTTDFWQGILHPDFSDSVSAHMDHL